MYHVSHQRLSCGCCEDGGGVGNNVVVQRQKEKESENLYGDSSYKNAVGLIGCDKRAGERFGNPHCGHHRRMVHVTGTSRSCQLYRRITLPYTPPNNNLVHLAE